MDIHTQHGEPIWLPRETRGLIYSFHRELVRRERELRAKFVPVLKDILVLGQCPQGVRTYVRNIWRDFSKVGRLFMDRQLVFFRDIYSKHNDVREWARTTVPEKFIKDCSSQETERERIWYWWQNMDPTREHINFWGEVYRIVKGMFNVRYDMMGKKLIIMYRT